MGIDNGIVCQVGSHEKMAMQIVPLKELVADEPKLYTVNLVKNMDPNDEANAKKRGELTFEMTFKPFKEEDNVSSVEEMEGTQRAPEGTSPNGGLLLVTIHSAEDVEGKHHTNPYAEVHFRGEKQKTQVIKKNRDPRWDKEFQWQLEDTPANDRLRVEVHSKGSSMNMVHRQESLGYVDIPLNDVVKNKRINETFQLIDSGRGKIQVEMNWRTT